MIPTDVGERLTGKVGDFSVGAINIQTVEQDATPATTFTVLRVKRDILRRSSIGAIFTNRSESTVVPGATNQAAGVDALFIAAGLHRDVLIVDGDIDRAALERTLAADGATPVAVMQHLVW